MENSEYLEMFIEESKEHIQSLNNQILVLENEPENMATIGGEIFRSAHTLKGMSATMGFKDLANLTHKMENVLDAVRNDQLKINSDIIDVIFQAVDQLEGMVLDIADGGNGFSDVGDLVKALQAIEDKEEPIKSNKQSATATSQNLNSTNSNAIHFGQLDQFELAVLDQSDENGFNNLEVKVKLNQNCLLKAARVYMVFEVLEQIGEVIKADPSVQELEEENFELEFHVLLVTKDTPEEVKQKILKVSEIEEVTASVFEQKIEQKDLDSQAENNNEQADNNQQTKQGENKSKTTKAVGGKTIRVNIDRLDGLMNLFEELVIDRGRLEQISGNLKNAELQETVERMSRISGGDLQNIILNMRMVPVEQVFNRFPRMVRQLSKDLNKKINLEIVGAETELDRTVIDEIGDPLVHLIRNALDHGVETPEIRKTNGKDEVGRLLLKAYHSGNHVFIEISDDGAGINREKVISKAISNRVISEEEATQLTDKKVNQLIMSSGFSTADKISDISGRGVGLDVVKNTIESLGGTITIESKEGKGSLFSIQLPLTLSIISVLLVEVEKEKYAVPLSSIIETAIINKSEILNAHNKKVIDFRGKVVPLIDLKQVFEVPSDQQNDEFYSIVIIRKGDKMAGLVVDSFIGQQEIVLKSLGDYLGNVFAISGATILGDGQVALIVDTNTLIN
ncbi:signal transduction histidine kinase CheA [Gracilibacillus boraciitolerans JCM 21714]|uniref:Chemotaxis protein CheA n=1 Tax=Gracilibacillus boraciitolerans JCM 21714 TaxID=1298598 RepID=W4VDW7_9BACI|nr:chemotaxis protein CheA [Gracilibacillus boraciitolerans]GAE91605.1 signal transduction histidine kinase CheA [Gracilibacillus boraciitolerans JCM 21714]